MELNEAKRLPTIALFDDDAANIKLYSGYFRNHFDIKGFQNPHHFKEALKEDVSAILIDVMMPVMDGIKLYSELQNDAEYNGCPVIFLSATSCDEILKKALDSGGQDFLTRNMTKDEMILRVKNKITFFKSNRTIYKLGNVKIFTNDLRAIHQNKTIDLTLTEVRIMKFLIREYPRLSTREEINNEVWIGQKVMPTTLNTHLSNLRSKFPGWEYDIINVKGKGVQVLPKN